MTSSGAGNCEVILRGCASKATSRIDLWTSILNAIRVRSMVEVGVYRGHFASEILAECPTIDRYYMIDPWRHLKTWNKPSNVDDATFDDHYSEAISVTNRWGEKRIVLRGTTTEASDRIRDGDLDFAYIDGDHTLRGITIDLLRIYSKVRRGGLVGGDDFTPSIWQHSKEFEPTFVFPFAVYFAEAIGARIYSLPFNQFVIEKSDAGFAFMDLTGTYATTDIASQVMPRSEWWRIRSIPGFRRLRGR